VVARDRAAPPHPAGHQQAPDDQLVRRAELLQGVGLHVTLWWKSVWCPYCEAAPGDHCMSKTGKRVATHVDRHREAAYQLFDGGPEDDEDGPDLDFVRVRPSRGMTTVYLPGDAP
jgi:hypothetical protein